MKAIILIKTEFENYKEDIKVLKSGVYGLKLFGYLYAPGFRVITIIRFSKILYLLKLKLLSYIVCYINEIVSGVQVGPRAQIGKGAYMAHPRGLIISPDAKIGNYCIFYSNVVIGGSRVIIGHNCTLGHGSRIFGTKEMDTIIGNNVELRANTVVANKIIPSNVVVAGLPGRIIKKLDKIGGVLGEILKDSEKMKFLYNL